MKKIHLTEQKLNKLVKSLNEDYRELYLPFDGNPNKPNYLQFLDHLEEIGYYGELEPSGYNPFDDENVMFDAGCDSFYYGYTEDSDEFDEDGWEEFLDRFNEKYGTEITSEDLESPFDIHYSNFDDEIKVQLKNEIIKTAEGEIRYLLTNTYTINDKGLIYVERQIRIPKLADRNKHTFNFMSNNYDGVGVYWSYAKGYAETYYQGEGVPNDNIDNINDDYYGKDYLNEETITLCGYVDPKDVRWDMAIRLTYVGEYEIRLKGGGKVQLEAIKTLDGKEFPLKKSLVVDV